MKTTMLMTLLGLVTVAKSAVRSPPAIELPSKSRFDKSVSTDTDGLRVNVIGREIEIHRADPATSASKLHCAAKELGNCVDIERAVHKVTCISS
jgi:hypothetical protein